MTPMLAGKYDPVLATFPQLASPKYDGIRALTPEGVLVSRKLIDIPNMYTQGFFAGNKGLDGELILGDPTAPDVYNRTNSFVMSRDKVSKEINWWVFDLLGQDSKPFAARFEALQRFAPEHPGIKVVPHEIIKSADDLDEYEQRMIDLGYEGVMVRSLEGRYKHGRSTTREGWLLKVKRYKDSEAYIVDILEEEANTNEATRDNLGRTKRSSAKAGKVGKGRMGKLAVIDVHTGVDFHVGTGFDDRQRAWFWQHREELTSRDPRVMIKYKFFPVGVKDRPRHPTYIGLRSEIDL